MMDAVGRYIVNHNWKNIWDKKSLKTIDLKRDEFSVFCDLKRADGFDVNVRDEQSYFRAFYSSWMKMYDKLKEITHDKIRSVYEVGCGSGVNLYLFQNRIRDGVLGGIDYSSGLIDLANDVLPDQNLVCGDAEQMDTETKYDLVMADSVFQYFGSQEYAESILNKMISKADKAVYLSEIHDIKLREEWLEYRRRSMENYDQIYHGLDKMFYSRDWLTNIAEKRGRQAVFFKSENPEYWNSRYVFNCFIFSAD